MTLANLGPGLRTYVLADSGISDTVGTRMYPERIPQSERKHARACIVYRVVSGLGDHHMAGASGLSRPRMQIDCYAPDFDDAVALALLVKERIDGFKGAMGSVTVQGVFFEDERDGHDAKLEWFWRSLDFHVWFEER